MPDLTFPVETILRALLAECVADSSPDEVPTPYQVADWISISISEAEFVASDEFENVHQLIFEDSSKHYSCRFERNDGAGYNDFFGASSTWGEESYPFHYVGNTWVFNAKVVATTHFQCEEVHQVTKTISVWEPVLAGATDVRS